jgi:hypothetical protein
VRAVAVVVEVVRGVGRSGCFHRGLRDVAVELFGSAAADDGGDECDEDGYGDEAGDCEYPCYFSFVREESARMCVLVL